MRAAYHHRARYHKGCRAMVLGLPGAKRSRFKFAGEAQREAHKIKIRKVASMAPMELLAVSAADQSSRRGLSLLN